MRAAPEGQRMRPETKGAKGQRNQDDREFPLVRRPGRTHTCTWCQNLRATRTAKGAVHAQPRQACVSNEVDPSGIWGSAKK
eukprot:3991058-Alexandrium_andersonii.AAC.1